ncbi:MAG: hypothetical protein E7384_06170 [Ruminococcaceae bacterium]|nr:hypothetical protein [Oscillospiraceae bacterium]
MKRFDKGYIYSSLLSDLFGIFVIASIFLKNFFSDKSVETEDILHIIPFFVIVFVVVCLCFITYRIMYYKTSGYELTDTGIKCNRGVFFRKRSILEYSKIHAINKKQSIFHRIFGIAVLTVDSGSTNTSHQAEITIIEKNKTVDLLLQELNVLKEGGVQNGIDSGEELLLSDKDNLYNFTSGRKMLYTVINIVSTVFFTALFALLSIIVIGICKLMIQHDFLGTWGEYFLYTFLIAVAAMLLFSFFTFIGCMIHSFVGYHKFAVTKRGSDIVISYGLLERHTNTFSYDRIKAVKISQSLVQRMLGFATVKLEVIGYTHNTDDDNQNVDLGVLVPFCKYDEVGEILAKVLPDYVPDIKQTKSVSYFPFVSWFLLVLGIVISVVLILTVTILSLFNVAASVIFAVSVAIIATGIVVFIVKAMSAALSYQNNGIAVSDDKITAYYGGFVKNVTVFNSQNLIAVEDVTTPLRKKKGIASLVMHLKTNALSNEVKVHIQKDEISEELECQLIL